MGGRVFCTRGIKRQHKSLWIVPSATWAELEAGLRGGERGFQFGGPRARLREYLLGYSEEAQVDRQGRVLLPAGLRDWAGCERELMLRGEGTHLAVWALDEWRRYEQAELTLGQVFEDAREFDWRESRHGP